MGEHSPVRLITVHSFLIHPISNSLVSDSPHKTTTRIIGRVLKPLKPILVVLVVVLVVLVVVLWGESETSELEMG